MAFSLRGLHKSRAGCSLLLLAGLDLGLGGTLDSLSLALKFLGQFTGSFLFFFDYFVLY